MNFAYTCRRFRNLIRRSHTKIQAQFPMVIISDGVDFNGEIENSIYKQMLDAYLVLRHKINRVFIDISPLFLNTWGNSRAELKILSLLTRFDARKLEEITLKSFAFGGHINSQILESFKYTKIIRFIFNNQVDVKEPQIEKILSSTQNLESIIIRDMRSFSGSSLLNIPQNQLKSIKIINTTIARQNFIPLFLEKQREIQEFTFVANKQATETWTVPDDILVILRTLSHSPKLKNLKIIIPEDFNFSNLSFLANFKITKLKIFYNRNTDITGFLSELNRITTLEQLSIQESFHIFDQNLSFHHGMILRLKDLKKLKTLKLSIEIFDTQNLIILNICLPETEILYGYETVSNSKLYTKVEFSTHKVNKHKY